MKYTCLLLWNPKLHPIGSMYGIFTYIYHKNQPNVGKYTIHGSYGYCNTKLNQFVDIIFDQTMEQSGRFHDPVKPSRENQTEPFFAFLQHLTN